MRITVKGQVTIPLEIREKLGLLPNTEVEFEIDRDAVRMKKATGPHGPFQGPGPHRAHARTRDLWDVNRSDHAVDARMSAVATLVDANVLLDVLTEDDEWFDWSSAMLTDAANQGPLIVNPIIYAEVSAGFTRIEDVDEALPADYYRRAALPWEAGFLAGHAYVKYRRGGGVRRSPMPDFYVGAHAAVAGLTLLTRDAKRYRAYFPTLRVVAP